MIATRAAALAALATHPAGWVAIMVPDRRAGHYEVCTADHLAAVALYELVAVR